jgi:hypothetical protein
VWVRSGAGVRFGLAAARALTEFFGLLRAAPDGVAPELADRVTSFDAKYGESQ